MNKISIVKHYFLLYFLVRFVIKACFLVFLNYIFKSLYWHRFLIRLRTDRWCIQILVGFWPKGPIISKFRPPPFQLDFFKLWYCHRFLIRMQIFNLIRRLEGGENHVERIHYIQMKLILYKAWKKRKISKSNYTKVI